MRFVLFIIIAFSLHLNSQENRNNVFSLKPALGINGCQIHGDSYSGYNKVGIFAGAALNARFNKRASLDLGFYFSQKGSRHNPNPKSGDYSYYRVNLNYIDLPVSFRFRVNENYFVTAGPSIAYLASYSENINYTDMTGRYKFSSYEIGVNAGLGRKIKGNFYVEVRTSNSVNAIRSWGMASTVFYPNPVARFFNKGFYNNIITLFFAYHIDLKNKNAS